MRLSTKGRYAVTAMMDLALHDKDGPVPLTDIAVCQSISLSYLEQLFARLRRRKLVKSVRGVHGGYLLARAADKISVADIFAAVDEKVETLADEDKERAESSPEARELAVMWGNLSQRLYKFLSSISLADCVDRAYVRELAQNQDKRHRRVAGGRKAKVGKPKTVAPLTVADIISSSSSR